jgi:hypothetical protein
MLAHLVMIEKEVRNLQQKVAVCTCCLNEPEI